jgi:LysM repeat protein
MIIVVLLLYLAVTITLGVARRSSDAVEDTPPPPTQTLRPTFENTATASLTSSATPPATTTQVPPATMTPTVQPSPTMAPSPTPSLEPPPTPTVGSVTHRVQRGENLIGIAARYGTTVRAIVRANGLANPDVIFIGQKLIIPLPTQPAPTPTPSG